MTSHNPLLVSPDDAPHLVDDPAVDARLDRLRADGLRPGRADGRCCSGRRRPRRPTTTLPVACSAPGSAGRMGRAAPGHGEPREFLSRNRSVSRSVAPIRRRRRSTCCAGGCCRRCSERGWRRVAVTSPTRGCGKSTVAANLALSLSRRPSGRTVLLDLDLRRPGQAGAVRAARAPLPMRDLLSGRAPPAEAQLIRAGRGLALGLNGRAEAAAAELLLEPAAQVALARGAARSGTGRPDL
jgi:Mrp family chromosome partitioning ATPase